MTLAATEFIRRMLLYPHAFEEIPLSIRVSVSATVRRT